jgi:hypothetical protein
MAHVLTDGSLISVMQSPDGAAVLRHPEFARIVTSSGDAAKILTTNEN